MPSLVSRFSLLPVLVVVAALAFGVRFGEIVSGKSYYAGALAQTPPTPSEESLSAPSSSVQPASTPPVTQTAKDVAKTTEDGTKAQPPAEPAEDNKKTADTPEAPASSATSQTEESADPSWKDSGDSDLEFSDARMALFKDLSARRQDIESREKEVALREALLKAGEQEIDQKYKELSALKAEIQNLLKQQSAEEEKRAASLVKIYEGMKAKDAARIFDTLDMDVLIQVLGRMSERKSAPIIAAMSAERARSLTVMLAEQKRLPGLADDVQGEEPATP
ncbi:MAG: flagellar protein FlbB [Alphaproteobacteria bacterium]|nr:flagellar protein FlbB [Alphaproteobacteria bacterium]